MKPNFSEFTYGFSLTYELVNMHRAGIEIAPVFPSLIDEGRNGGYDAEIRFWGVPLFLQFKLSNYMVRSKAKEYSLFSAPYYRIELMASRHSEQHQMLIDLENKGNIVYYSAPRFHLSLDLNRHFLSGLIVENSIFIRPNLIGPLPDSNDHSVCFTGSSPIFYFCSEPQKFKVENFTDKISLLKEKKTLIDDEYLNRVESELLDLIIKYFDNEHVLKIKHILEKNKKPINRISILSRLGFDCEFVILGMSK